MGQLDSTCRAPPLPPPPPPPPVPGRSGASYAFESTNFDTGFSSLDRFPRVETKPGAFKLWVNCFRDMGHNCFQCVHCAAPPSPPPLLTLRWSAKSLRGSRKYHSLFYTSSESVRSSSRRRAARARGRSTARTNRRPPRTSHCRPPPPPPPFAKVSVSHRAHEYSKVVARNAFARKTNAGKTIWKTVVCVGLYKKQHSSCVIVSSPFLRAAPGSPSPRCSAAG
jgi:hypothetical protein